jgi:hypothetical protein
MFKAYTYYLYHVPTGKKYYGVRWANKCEPEQDLWNEYFGSCDKVDELVKEYGRETFLAEVRKTFDTAQEAHTWEQNVLRRINAVNRDDWLNQALANGPFYRQGPQTKDHIEKRIKKLRGRIPWNKNKKMPIGFSDKVRRYRTGKSSGMKNKSHAEITKTKISSKMAGEAHHMYGKKHTIEARIKMGRPILTPKGIFLTCVEASIVFGVSTSTITKRCQKKIFGFSYVGDL